MYDIKLSKEQLNNLLLFLDRVYLKGINEARALTELVLHLNHQVEINEKEKFNKNEVKKS